MLFQSATFIWTFLLPVLAVFYAAACFGVRPALGVLVVASLIFYGWSHPWHLAVLLGSIGINFFLAGRIIALRGTPWGRVYLVFGIALNVGVLVWFKYAVFFSGIVGDITGHPWGLKALVLPLGVSFFTFQKIAYLVDARRGVFTAQRWSDYTLFVTFFPQLIAGPIVHQTEFFPQIDAGEFAHWRGERMIGGASIFILGMAKKLLLADTLAHDADSVFLKFAGAVPVGSLEAWGGVLAYSFQIYFDFSAYTDMAIGLALLFGITLPENFAAPYRATSIIEFWRRWHITLSRFLRDYLYVPLGGNKGGRLGQSRNLLITMLLGGLWHGAAWTFVIWGAFHGVALTLNHALRRWRWRCPAPLGWLATFTTITVAWVFFRADDFRSAGQGLRALFGANGFWPAGIPNGWAWLRSFQPKDAYKEVFDLFYYLDWRGKLGSTGPEWRYILLSDTAWASIRLIVAFAVVLFATPSVRWLWDLQVGRGRFSSWKATVVGGLLLAVILLRIDTMPSTFIYFRF